MSIRISPYVRPICCEPVDSTHPDAQGSADRHTDGSGVCYSSWLRPIVNMRPKYDMPFLDLGKGSPHQFNADLHLIDWLEEKGIEYDIITDLEVHYEGVERLSDYRVVSTASHNEYWSEAMLDAAEAYADGGGRFMYLSGNGVFWVTALDEATGTGVEIRRSGPAQRTWNAAPGESWLSTSGEPGGLWRFRGRAPQKFLGIGSIAEGGGVGRPYDRQPASFEPKAAFIFDGIGDDEQIGAFVAWSTAGVLQDSRSARPTRRWEHPGTRWSWRVPGTSTPTIGLSSAKSFSCPQSGTARSAPTWCWSNTPTAEPFSVSARLPGAAACPTTRMTTTFQADRERLPRIRRRAAAILGF